MEQVVWKKGAQGYFPLMQDGTEDELESAINLLSFAEVSHSSFQLASLTTETSIKLQSALTKWIEAEPMEQTTFEEELLDSGVFM